MLLFPVILRKNLGRLTGFVVIKSQLILRIAGQNPHLFQRDVVKVVDAILDQIVSALAQGDRVELRGFGSFSAKLRGGRVAENRRYTARTRKNHFCFQAEQGKSQAAQLRWLTHQKRLFQNHRILQGKLNAVKAAFKAGVTPARIAREFGISQADVRRALIRDAKRN